MPNISFLEYQAQAEQAKDKQTFNVVRIITNTSLFLRRLRFITVPEFAYVYARQQTTGGIAFRGLNETYTPDTGVINPETELLKIFGGSSKTDRQLAIGPRGEGIRANNVAAKVQRAGLSFDKAVIKGDTTVDPKGFDGLHKRLTGNQVIKTATNGGVLTLAKLDLALDQTIGSNDQKIIVCNKDVRRQIKNLVLDKAGGAAVADVNAPLPSYSGATIEVIDEDGDQNPILAYDEVCGNSSVTTSLEVINVSGDIDEQNVRGLVRDRGKPLIEVVEYQERSGFVEDLIESVMGLAVFHPRAATRLMGILKP